MQAKPDYILRDGRDTIGKLWLAVSELGLVAIEWGLTQAEFEAYLVNVLNGNPARPAACAGSRHAD